MPLSRFYAPWPYLLSCVTTASFCAEHRNGVVSTNNSLAPVRCSSAVILESCGRYTEALPF